MSSLSPRFFIFLLLFLLLFFVIFILSFYYRIESLLFLLLIPSIIGSIFITTRFAYFSDNLFKIGQWIGFIFLFIAFLIRISKWVITGITKEVFSNHLVHWDIYVLSVWAMITAITGLCPKISMVHSIWFLIGCFSLIEIGRIARNRESLFNKEMLSFALVCIPFIIFSLLDFGALKVDSSMKWEGIFNSGVESGTLTATFSIIALSLIYLHKLSKQTTIIFAIFLPLTMFLVVLSSCRSAWIASLLASLYFTLLSSKKTRKFVPVFIMILVIILSLTLPMRGYFNERVVSPLERRDFSSRDTIWLSNLAFVKQRPLLGSGLAGYWRIWDYAEYSSFDITSCGPHNIFVEYLVEMGVPGLLLFLVIIFRSFRLLNRNSESYPKYKSSLKIVLLGGFALATFNSMTSLPISSTFWMIYISLILMRFKGPNNS